MCPPWLGVSLKFRLNALTDVVVEINFVGSLEKVQGLIFGPIDGMELAFLAPSSILCL